MYQDIINKTEKTLIEASSRFREDQKAAYESAISKETNPQAKWVLMQIYENALIAEKNSSPLCDDTGIPHVVLDIGPEISVSGQMIEAIQKGIANGLEKLPGRPMAVAGDDISRLEQSEGLISDPGCLKAAPVMLRYTNENRLKLNILMQGGGPEIRSKTYRVFHKHSIDTITDEIIDWACEEVGNLGCTPCTVALGIGRTHYEASSLMIQAMLEGDYSNQSNLENLITSRVNESDTGSLGLGGKTTALGTFIKIGEQRASGVRIVCMRLCCCFEPRKASIYLK